MHQSLTTIMTATQGLSRAPNPVLGKTTEPFNELQYQSCSNATI